MKNWETNIDKFIELSNKYEVRMLMVGGGAVNFHGYRKDNFDIIKSLINLGSFKLFTVVNCFSSLTSIVFYRNS